MKNIIYAFICLANLKACREPLAKNRTYPTSTDKQIVWNNCYSCHDPIRKSVGIAQVEMIGKIGQEKFKAYLYNSFKYKTNCAVIEHCRIKLTDKEVESVYLFIKESKRYVN